MTKPACESGRRGVAPRVLPLLAVLIALPACSMLGTRSGPSDEALGEVAENLVFTLVQLPDSNPMTTTVQLTDPVTPFGDEVVRRIREAGYGIQAVPDDRGDRYLRYRVESVASELGTETRYAVSIGDVAVERAFDTADGRLVPTSRQRVSGAARSTVELADEAFADAIDPAVSGVTFAEDAMPELTDAATGAVADLPAPPPGAFGARVKRNLYDGLTSNYAELFAAYGDVDSTTIVFPNDSLRLGTDQKLVIESYAERLRPETDLLSVIGCSHGNTQIPNGNGLLALGRANRVKEALVFAGVPPAAVLDEGCWAGTFHETFPKRGVVLTLKRRLG